MAHIRQSRPDSGLNFQIKVLETFSVVPFTKLARAEGKERTTKETSRSPT